MKIEDCKVGMKVQAKKDIGYGNIKVGDLLTVRLVDKDEKDNCEGYLYFDEIPYVGIDVDSFQKKR